MVMKTEEGEDEAKSRSGPSWRTYGTKGAEAVYREYLFYTGAWQP